MELKKRFYELMDKGIPIPLLRHKGRGDLVATIAILFAVVICFLLLLGGTTYEAQPGTWAEGLKLQIPSLNSLGAAGAAVASIVGSLMSYVSKRKQDVTNGNGKGE